MIPHGKLCLINCLQNNTEKAKLLKLLACWNLMPWLARLIQGRYLLSFYVKLSQTIAVMTQQNNDYSMNSEGAYLEKTTSY